MCREGGCKIPVHSTASIIAKVTRDRILMELSQKYPDYDFERHKGYGTKIHRRNCWNWDLVRVTEKDFTKILGGEWS